MLRLPTAALFGAMVAVPDTTREGLSQRRTMIVNSLRQIAPETVHDHETGRGRARGCKGGGGVRRGGRARGGVGGGGGEGGGGGGGSGGRRRRRGRRGCS